MKNWIIAILIAAAAMVAGFMWPVPALYVILGFSVLCCVVPIVWIIKLGLDSWDRSKNVR